MDFSDGLDVDRIEQLAAQLLAKVSTISAYTYKKSVGESFAAPRKDMDYIPNFLHMMFSTSSKEYKIENEMVSALRTLLILHADHEQNCSTSAVRLVGSSWANLFASISAGVCALWGPLHGGANQKVVEMLEQIQNEGGGVQKYIEKSKDPSTVSDGADPEAVSVRSNSSKPTGTCSPPRISSPSRSGDRVVSSRSMCSS